MYQEIIDVSSRISIISWIIGLVLVISERIDMLDEVFFIYFNFLNLVLNLLWSGSGKVIGLMLLVLIQVILIVVLYNIFWLWVICCVNIRVVCLSVISWVLICKLLLIWLGLWQLIWVECIMNWKFFLVSVQCWQFSDCMYLVCVCFMNFRQFMQQMMLLVLVFLMQM